MQTGLDIKFNNKYHVELIDSLTGKIKQSGDFHNTHLIGFYHLLIGKSSYSDTESSWDAHYFDMCKYLNVGSGTTEPTFTNTKLAAALWSAAGTVDSVEWIDDYTIRKTATFSFPATSSYVGTVTEVAMEMAYYNYYRSLEHSNILTTRALLTDSEGQIISFNKTDLDVLIITVTAEVSLASLSDKFKVHKKSLFLRGLVGLDVPTWSYNWRKFQHQNGLLNLIRFKQDYEDNTNGGLYDQNVPIGSAVVSKLTADEAYLRYPVGRMLATTVTEQTFYCAVSLPSLGYWPLPNEEVFPAYSITNTTIGTGDGVTTFFENPFNYFKKDSERVYKNGVLLTRDIDYTINHMGNKDCKPEVAQLYPIIAVRSDVDIAAYMGDNSISVRHLITPSANYKSVKLYDMQKEASVFNANYPLYIEYAEEVTMNCLKCPGGLYGIGSGGGYSPLATGTIFYLDYSVDGETYIEIGSVKTAAQYGVFTMDFADVTAKYWRIRTNYSANLLGLYYGYSNSYLTLNRKDPYIVFAEAPAEGDTLTMDVEMDLIMKSGNYVIDMGCRIDFKI